MNVLFFGLGRIGLPQSLVFASKKIKVYGYDIDESVIDLLQSKKTYFYEPNMEQYLNKYLNKTFFPISEWQTIITDIDFIVFTLGTEAPNHNSCIDGTTLNMSLIEKTLIEIFTAKYKKGINLIFRTTLPVGSTDKFKMFIENKFNLVEGIDFSISFVPERLVEGQAITEEETLPKIIGSYSEESFEKVSSLFSKIGGQIIKVGNPKTAEFCKLTDNTYRNTMFAYVNDLAITCTELGIDVIDVLSAVNSDYERNLIPKPGFVSGYCLGKDPYILEYSFDKDVFLERGFHSLWYYGRRINDYLYDYVVKKTISEFKNTNITITILGASFKENIDDFRMSHTFNIIDKFKEKGITKFKLFDPNLNKNKYTKIDNKYEGNIVYSTNKINNELFISSEVIIISHMHNEIKELNDVVKLKSLIPQDKNILVIDGWNILRNIQFLNNVKYISLGYGE